MSSIAATVSAVSVAIFMVASSGHAQDWRTVTSLRQFKAEKVLTVDVEYGAGRLFITPGEASTLYKATLRYDANAFRPVTEYVDGRLRVGIEGGSVKGRNMKSGRLDLALGTRVPLNLNLQFGAVRAQMELGGLRIREAHIQTGASETDITVSGQNREPCSMMKVEVGAAAFNASGLGNLNCERFEVSGGVGDVKLDFNGAWRVDSDIDIDMGLGSLTLSVPRGLGMQVRKSGFLASFDSQGLIKRGNVYYSEDWEQATNRINVNIDAAFGTIRVVWVDPEAQFTKAARDAERSN